MRKIIVLFLLVVVCSFAAVVRAESAVAKSGIKISNRLFAIELPAETKGTYNVKKKKDGIFIYDKVSQKAGFGGFAFGIKAYYSPSDYAMMPGGKKLGELRDKRKKLYDIVLIRPTDVQFDYVNNRKETYMPLYNYAEKVNGAIYGKKDTTYYDGQGTLGKYMYNEAIQKHITAIKEKWNSEKLEQENMSYMYNILAQSNKNLLDKVGYAFYDANGDGIDELLIGEIANGAWKGVVYDIYTMVNRKPAHVVSGGARNRYFVCDDTFVCNEYSSGALESGLRVYNLVENSTELFPQVFFKYDAYENKTNPWFWSYETQNDKWENVSEQQYKERKKTFETYKRFDYTPLSKYEKQ